MVLVAAVVAELDGPPCSTDLAKPHRGAREASNLFLFGQHEARPLPSYWSIGIAGSAHTIESRRRSSPSELHPSLPPGSASAASLGSTTSQSREEDRDQASGYAGRRRDARALCGRP